MIMVGLVITVVGLGDKGFQSIELKLVGPITVMCGGILASVRILMCTVPYTECGKRVRGWWVRDGGERSDMLQVPGRVARPGETGAKFENREVELIYENCNLGREGGYRQIIKPIRLVSNSFS